MPLISNSQYIHLFQLRKTWGDVKIFYFYFCAVKNEKENKFFIKRIKDENEQRKGWVG